MGTTDVQMMLLLALLVVVVAVLPCSFSSG
jgi:hypothetical protein